MPSLRDLKKRLRSVKTTGQLAGAMRTVSTAKYSRASSLLKQNSPYAAACRELFGALEANAELSGEDKKRRPQPEEEPRAPRGGRSLYVLLSGNRGLCGGYNHELFAFFAERIAEAEDPLVIACGRMAAEYCREKSVPVYAEFPIADVPSADDAARLCAKLSELYDGGEVGRIYFVYQRFINMLRRHPAITLYLPYDAEGEDAPEGSVPFSEITGGAEAEAYPRGLIFIPDEETVRGELMRICLENGVYTLLLQCASGAQAATLMAMRSAYDNAQASAQRLETAINRRRQAMVTQSVLETSSDNQ